MAARHGGLLGRCLWMGWAWLLATSPARAQASSSDEQRRFAVEYQAPNGCPDALALIAAIASRSPGASAVAPEAAAVRFRVELSVDGHDTLWVDLPEGSSRREFEANSCAEALESMAVIASMVLEADPKARLSATEAAVPSAPAAGQPAPSVVVEPIPAAKRPAPPAPAPLAPAARRENEIARAPGRDHRSRKLRFSVSAGGALEAAVAPSPPWGATAGVEASLTRARFLAPSLRAETFVSSKGVERTARGEGSFWLWTGRLSACPVRLALAQPFRLLPCLAFDAGSLHAQGGGAATHTKKQTMPWLAGGAMLRAQLDVWRGLSLEASGSVRALARRDSFIFSRPDSLVYAVPALSWGLAAGVSLRLP
jgi:hypothetical protein